MRPATIKSQQSLISCQHTAHSFARTRTRAHTHTHLSTSSPCGEKRLSLAPERLSLQTPHKSQRNSLVPKAGPFYPPVYRDSGHEIVDASEISDWQAIMSNGQACVCVYVGVCVCVCVCVYECVFDLSHITYTKNKTM